MLPAESVRGAFAIVKTERRASLGIIKTTGISSLKIYENLEEMFAFKHFAKTIKEQILTVLLIIFTLI